MKYVYICGASPAIINDMQGASVAGNKFSLILRERVADRVKIIGSMKPEQVREHMEKK